MVLCGRVPIANGEGSLGKSIILSICSCSELAGNWHQARCEGFKTGLHMTMRIAFLLA